MVPNFDAFLGDDGHLSSVNGACYLCLLQNTTWSKLWYAVTRTSLWWMHDGALTHCTNAVLAFLNEKFRGWVISWRTANPWPVHSPNFNFLDFYSWAAGQNRVFEENPNSIFLLVQCVKSFAERLHTSKRFLLCEISWHNISRVRNNILKRATVYLEAGGGHFEHFLQETCGCSPYFLD